MTGAVRTIIEADPFRDVSQRVPWPQRGRWPATWISCPDVGEPPFVTAFRCRFSVDADAIGRIHVTADERYELFLDGVRIGRGSERGTPDAWSFETYDLTLEPGPHILVARVWTLGAQAPFAQFHVRSGFLLAAEGSLHQRLSTGVAGWEAKRLDGYEFVDPTPAWGTGSNLRVNGAAFPWGFHRGDGIGWRPAERGEDAVGALSAYEFPRLRLLQPARLPPMVDEEHHGGTVRLVAAFPAGDPQAIAVDLAQSSEAEQARWAAVLERGEAVVVPPHTRRRVLIDLVTYLCAYPTLEVSGGAGGEVRVGWAESLCHTPDLWCKRKGDRNAIDGKYFAGVGDTFLPDGGPHRHFDTLWWQAGRYVELLISTRDEPLTVERFTLRETRYPLELESRFAASNPRLARTIPILVRGMQMCSHETYIDCPYYEQLMYAGDTRLEALTTYIMTRDSRLPRKALDLFDRSRLASGLTQSRYPSNVLQIIAPFALWWVGMVRDYAFWRDDSATVHSLMPGLRATVEGYRRFLGPDGLVHAPPGWIFLDWVPAWQPGGVPPGAGEGANGSLNWQFVLTLAEVADLEERLGEQELARRAGRHAADLAAATAAAFWDEERGLFADDQGRQHFSEHTQCLAILSGQLDTARQAQVAGGLLRDEDLARTTISFSHYLFETYRRIGRIDALLDRMALWFDHERLGLTTPLEMPEPSRSDCHAWGAHPLYHYFATILGIRPVGLGFQTVAITPQLGPLASAEGSLVHPRGTISMKVHRQDDQLHGEITLPADLTGMLHLPGRTLPLDAVSNVF